LGILEENHSKLFTQGFTTKQNGHGFGLHSSANYIKEMQGEISAQSNGKGKGATFNLIFNALYGVYYIKHLVNGITKVYCCRSG